MKKLLGLTSVIAVALMRYAGAQPATDAIIVWNANAAAAATAACLAPLANPLHESRMYAMAHIAMHDAVNAIDRRSRPYAFDMQAPPDTNADAAVAAAARTVLVALISQLPLELHAQTCIDDGIASVEAAYTAALVFIPDGQPKAQGIALGQAAAAAILQLRADDGAVGPFLNPDCPEDTEPGEYQCTPGTPVIAFRVLPASYGALRNASSMRRAPSASGTPMSM